MAFTRKNTLIRTVSLILLILLLFPADLSQAENVGNSITIGIQSTKTLTIRPFEPLETDILSAYHAVYESLVVLDDSYVPQH